MKKSIYFGVLAVAILAVGGFIVYQNYFAKSLHVENILPEGPLVYVRLNNAAENFERLSSSKSWQTMIDLRYDTLFGKKSTVKDQSNVLDSLKEKMMHMLADYALKKLFGKEFAVGFYPVNLDLNSLRFENKADVDLVLEKVLPRIVVVTRVDQDVKIIDALTEFFSGMGEEITVGEEEYKNSKISILSLNKSQIKLGYTYVKNFLVLGFGDTAAKVVIDVLRGDKPALNTDERLIRIRKDILPHESFVGLVDAERIVMMIKDQQTQTSSLDPAADHLDVSTDRFFDQLAGFQYFGISAEFSDPLAFKGVLYFDSNKMDSGISTMYSACQPRENKSIQFVPKDVLYYQWVNCLDLPFLWKEVKSEIGNTNSGSDQSNGFFKMVESMENDLLPAFGDEIGGYLADVKITEMFPILNGVFFIKIGDKVKLESLLASVMKRSFIPFKSEDHGSVNIQYVRTPFSADLEPGFAIFEDYLFIFTQREFFKTSLDAASDRSRALLSSDRLKEVHLGSLEKVTHFQFIDLAGLVPKLKETSTWVRGWMVKQQESKEAFASGSERRLKEQRKIIVQSQEDQEILERESILLKDQIMKMKEQGLVTLDKESELTVLQEKIAVKIKEIDATKEQVKDLEKIVSKFQEQLKDSQSKEILFKEIVDPVLEGLTDFKSFGLESFKSNDSVATTIYLKLKD